MKIKCILLINFLINMIAITTMEKIKKSEKQKLVLFIQGSAKYIEHLKGTKNATNIVISLEEKKLTINDNLTLDITGKRKRENKEPYQKKNNKKQKKNLSLEEEESNIEKSQIPLILGNPVTVGNEPESITLILDEETKLVRKKDKREKIIRTIFPYSSDWKKSAIIQGAINPTTKELRRYDGKVFLEEAEVKLLASVYDNDKETRRRLLNTFPIIQLAELLALLDKHDPARKFDPYCNYFDDIRQLLEEKVIKAFQTSDLNWLKTMNNLPLEIKNIMENTFKRLMKPVPHPLHWINLGNEIEVQDHFVKNKMIIHQTIKLDRQEIKVTKVIDLENGEIVFEGYGIKSISLTAGDKVIICYQNKITELRDLKTNTILFWAENIKDTTLNSSTETILTILFENGRGIVIDLITNSIIFKEENLGNLFVNRAGDMLVVLYEADEDGYAKGAKIMGISNDVVTTLYERNGIDWINVSSVAANIIVRYKNKKKEVGFLKWAERTKKIFTTIEEADYMSFNSSFTVIATWDEKGNGIIRDLEKNKILKLKGVETVNLNSKGKRAIIEFKNQEGLIINLETGKHLWQKAGLREPTSLYERFVIAYYNDNNVEIIDIENGETILKKKDIEVIKIMPNKLAIIKFLSDNSQGIIDLPNRMVLFRDKNVSKIICNEQEMKATILYQEDKKNTFVTMDLLKDHNKSLTFITLRPEELVRIFYLSTNLNFQNEKEIRVYLSLIRKYRTMQKWKLVQDKLAKKIVLK